jgi:hypothetical protein
MDALRAAPAAPHLLQELADHLKMSGNTNSIAQVTNDAIRAWIDADKARSPQAAEPSRGYQWKTVFLPDSTELRMECAGTKHYARVVGDNIIYAGRSVSPRGMTLAVAGDGRNAWRDLWIRLPGERNWKSATRCRRDAERSKPPDSPVQTMAAAAAAMSDALKTALALVEHSNAQTARKVERRGQKHRRESDLLGEDCAFID